jgi:hypothetical protein
MLTLTICSDNFTRRSVAEPGLLEAEGAVIFGQASNPLVSTMTDILKPKVKQDGIYSQPNANLLSRHTFGSPGSNLSSDTGNSSVSTSASTLPTSEDGQSDAEASDQSPPMPINPGTPKLVEKGSKGQSRSLKRGHSGDDARCAEHPYRRPRTQCSQQVREIDVPLEAVDCNKPLNLMGMSEGRFVTSLAEKTNEDGTNFSLRRKNNFIRSG